MSTVRGGTAAESRGLLSDVRSSLINQYWKFSLVPVATATSGMVLAVASRDLSWDWRVWAITALFLWITDQGMKSINLAAPDLNLEVNSTVQFRVGAAMVASGVALGVLLAALSTWWFLVPLAIGVTLGLAYNLEWFDGKLHHRTYATGRLNLGFCTAGLPAVVGYLALAGTVSPGIVVFAVGPTLDLAAMIWLTQDYKDTLYEVMGITYSREVDEDYERLKKRGVLSQLYRLGGMIAVAVGLYLELVLGVWV